MSCPEGYLETADPAEIRMNYAVSLLQPHVEPA